MRSLRQERLDHILPLSERHVRSVLAEFVSYYNQERPHRSLGLETPVPRRRPVHGEGDGLHAPALCFGDPRVMAILAALLLFCHVVAGFRNRDLVEVVSNLLDQSYTGRQATYDLRRLRRKGLITRSPHS